MVFILLNFLTAFLAFLAFSISLFSTKRKQSINYYFLIILLFVGSQRLFYSLLYLFEISARPSFFHVSYGYFIVPLYFLFLKDYLGYVITKKENLFHLMLASTLYAFHMLFNIDKAVKPYLFLIVTTIYMISLVILLFKFVKSKKINNMLLSRKSWFLIMLLLVLYIYIVSNLMLFSYIKTSFKVFEYYHSYTTIFWLVALSYLLINPAILYGKEHLKKIVRKEELTSNKLWRFKPIEKIKPIDAILHEKISENVIDLIHKIESFVSIYYENSKEILDFDTLSKGTNVLPYHLNYIFNYYCLFSKNDFFNYYKIRYALQLIEKGYLQNKTINALVKECNFNNKKTFYNNFQKFNTKNPMEINILTKYKM